MTFEIGETVRCLFVYKGGSTTTEIVRIGRKWVYLKSGHKFLKDTLELYTDEKKPYHLGNIEI